MFDRPWEDTLIIALRDLQWKKAAERNTLRDHLPAETLLKLDGNAESAIGDVVTAVKGRHFVLEMKADAGTMGAETEKTLPVLVTRLANDDAQAAQDFVKLSKMAHHLAFSEEADGTRTSAAGILERPFRVSTATYLTVATGVVANKDYRPVFERDVVALMYDKHEWPGESDKVRLGLPAAAMAAYLKFLVEAHRRGWPARAPVEGYRPERPGIHVALRQHGVVTWPGGLFDHVHRARPRAEERERPTLWAAESCAATDQAAAPQSLKTKIECRTPEKAPGDPVLECSLFGLAGALHRRDLADRQQMAVSEKHRDAPE